MSLNIIVTGGFEANFTMGFIKGLADNGLELLVVSCDDTAPRLDAAGIKHVNLRGSLEVKRSAGEKLWNLARYYGRLLLLLAHHRGATIHFIGIFRNELILWEGLMLNACFRLFAGRYIYTVHNVLPHSRGQSRFFQRIYRWIYRIPNLLFAHTALAKQQLMADFGVPADKICLTSIGLNEEMPETDLTHAEARRRLGIEEGTPALLFFGKIDEYKGLDLLLEAFARLQSTNVHLVVAGQFRNTDYRAKIFGQLEQMPGRGRIHLHERFIPNEEAEVFFKGCDSLCLPYRNIYQSGLVFLGPRFGLPIIATDVGSMREFIEGNELGLITTSNDAAGIAEALEKFLSKSDCFSRAGILMRASKYRWSNVCRDLAHFYSRRETATASGLPAEISAPLESR